MISIVSIPHTGTKFTCMVLLKMGCVIRHAHLHAAHPAQNGRQWLREDPKVVVPWREPSKVIESFQKRGEEPRPEPEFDEILEWTARPNVHRFRVEPDDREAELAALAEFVGADVPEIDWTPVNAFRGA